MPALPSPNSNIVCLRFANNLESGDQALTEFVDKLISASVPQVRDAQVLGGGNMVRDKLGALVQAQVKVITDTPTYTQADARAATTTCIIDDDEVENCDPVICPPREVVGDLDATAGLAYSGDQKLGFGSYVSGAKPVTLRSAAALVFARAGDLYPASNQLLGFLRAGDGFAGSYPATDASSFGDFAYFDRPAAIPDTVLFQFQVKGFGAVETGGADAENSPNPPKFDTVPAFEWEAGEKITLMTAGGYTRDYTFARGIQVYLDQILNENVIDHVPDIWAYGDQEGKLYLVRANNGASNAFGIGLKVTAGAETIIETDRQATDTTSVNRHSYAEACQYAPL